MLGLRTLHDARRGRRERRFLLSHAAEGQTIEIDSILPSSEANVLIEFMQKAC
jgi:hypothetical protein